MPPRADNAKAMTQLAEAYALDNDGASLADDTRAEPAITAALRSVSGGLPALLRALRAYDNDEAREFVEFYDSLTGRQRSLPLEVLAVASGLGCVRLREVAFSAVCDYGAFSTKLMLASSMPAIVKKSIASAKGNLLGSLADREWMLKAGAVLPVPKGAQIAIQTNVQVPQIESQEADEERPAWNQEAALKSIHDAQGERLGLPAATVTHAAPLSPDIDGMQRATVEALEDV